LDEVVASYTDDTKAKDLLNHLAISPSDEPNYELHQGLLCHKGRLWISADKSLQQRIIQAFHSSAVGGHSGFSATYNRIKQLFSRTGLKSSVHQFVSSCLTCQQAKPDRARYPGLLQPLHVPSMAWQSISMDFVEGLPSSGGKNCILVVVDRFSRYAHFLPLAHPYTALSVAKLFLQ